MWCGYSSLTYVYLWLNCKGGVWGYCGIGVLGSLFAQRTNPAGSLFIQRPRRSRAQGRAARGWGLLNGVQGDGLADADAHGGEGVALAVQALVALVVLPLVW